MIGKIVGALLGAQASNYSRNLGGASGAVIGALAVPVIRRMRITSLLAIGAGIYAAKKLADKDRAARRSPSSGTAAAT